MESQGKGSLISEVETNRWSSNGHEMFEQKDFPKLTPAKHKRDGVSQKTNKYKAKDGEMDSGFLDTTDLDESTVSTKETGGKKAGAFEDGEIQIKETISKNKEDSKNGEALTVNQVTEKSVSDYYANFGADKEPPRKKVKGGGKKFTVLLSNAPLSTKPEVIKQALEKIVGSGNILNVWQIWKLQPASLFTSFTSVFRADVSDGQTVKLLVELKPKLCINGQKVTIVENKTNKTKVTEEEARTVFISQIPVHACHEAIVLPALEAHVGKGRVSSVKICLMKKTGQPYGRAFALCSNVETAKRLLLLDSKIKISGRKISIECYNPDLKKNKKKVDKVVSIFFSNLPAKLNAELFKAKVLKLAGEVEFLEIEIPLVDDECESQSCAFVNLTDRNAVTKLLRLHQRLRLAGHFVNIQIQGDDARVFQNRIMSRVENNLSFKSASVNNSRRGSLSSNDCSVSHSVVSQDGRTIIDYGVDSEQVVFRSVRNVFENAGNSYGPNQQISLNNVNRGDHRQNILNNTHVQNNSISVLGHQNHGNIYNHKTCECAHCNRSIHINHFLDHQGPGSFTSIGQRQSAVGSIHDFNNISQGQNHQLYGNTNSFSHVNQNLKHSAHDNFNRVGWRLPAYESVHGSNNFVNFNHGWGHQGQDNFTRVAGNGQNSYENAYAVGSHNHLNQGHNNFTRVGLPQRAYEIVPNSVSTVNHSNLNYGGHGNVNRVGWRQAAYQSVHGSNAVREVDQRTQAGQCYELPDRYQNLNGYSYQ